MPAPRQHSVLVAAARLYYLDGKSQGEVAKELGVSRSSVSRILASARELGIVEIRIHPQGSLPRRDDLERALRELCDIGEIVVVARPANRLPLDVVAETTARLFEERLCGLPSIGLSWGRTIAGVVDHVLLEPIYPDTHIYPLVGGNPTGVGPAGNDSIQVLATKGGFTAHRFESPAVVESVITWDALGRESTIRRAIADAAAVQAAVVGIGSTDVHANPLLIEAMQLDDDELRRFREQRPVGDLCGQFFDLDGTVLGPPTSQRVIGVSLEQLGTVPAVIGVAGGQEKARGVAGAARTGVLDTLVVDEELAAAVVDLLRAG